MDAMYKLKVDTKDAFSLQTFLIAIIFYSPMMNKLTALLK